jgi:hypothetical protein
VVFGVVDRKYGERLAELAETVLRSVILESNGSHSSHSRNAATALRNAVYGQA